MIKPIRNNVVVEPLPGDEMSAGGIIVPESFRGRSCKAKILAVGNGSKDRPMKWPVGVVCWHIKDAGVPFEIDGKQYWIMDDRDLLGYLPNPN